MSAHSTPIPMIAHKSGPLTGVAEVPGDKSISHRALILGALSVGETHITGLLEGEDVIDTAKAMRAFGATVTRVGQGEWRVNGVGTGGFAEPSQVIDCGNSGTGVRLIMGGDGHHADRRDLHRRCQPEQAAHGGASPTRWLCLARGPWGARVVGCR